LIAQLSYSPIKEPPIMKFSRKAYGYVTRIHNANKQVLVFRHPLLDITEGGIQIPKGTIQAGETPLEAVRREIIEETGLTEFTVEREIAVDVWEYRHEGEVEQHERHFFWLSVLDLHVPDTWYHNVIGGQGGQGDGQDEGMVFRYFWVGSPDEVEIGFGHGDYLDRIFANEKRGYTS
jgi:8-oxo-dGTP pyrophosphatase MutT (NUDIX family)